MAGHECRWCGDYHPVDQLCQRAQRGLTRRSFCFLFGAGLAATALGIRPSEVPYDFPYAVNLHRARLPAVSDELLRDAAIDTAALFRRFHLNTWVESESA